jgi:hypothetical protein
MAERLDDQAAPKGYSLARTLILRRSTSRDKRCLNSACSSLKDDLPGDGSSRPGQVT